MWSKQEACKIVKADGFVCKDKKPVRKATRLGKEELKASRNEMMEVIIKIWERTSFKVCNIIWHEV